MDNTIEDVLKHANTFEDKLQAYSTRNRLTEAITTTLYVLGELGESLPENPGYFSIISEFVKTSRMLHGRSDRFFLSLLVATDTKKIAAINMLCCAVGFFYLSKPEKRGVAVCRIIRFVMKYGMAAPSIPAFAAYGFMLSMHFKRREEGVRFAQISLDLLGDLSGRSLQAWLPRTYYNVHGNVNRWAFPVRDSLDPLMLPYQTALKTGL